MQPINCRDLSAKEIVEYIIELNPDLRDVKNRIRVYVGVTRNIEERLRRHNAIEVLFIGQTANQGVAAAVEAEARRRGFYIGKVDHGGNRTNSYSILLVTMFAIANNIRTTDKILLSVASSPLP